MQYEHFSLHEVVAGVWAAVTDFEGIAIGNSAIIDVGGKTIVIDTFQSAIAAAELRQAAEQLTGNKVFLAVNSHWHTDHTWGNQVFADLPIVSTEATAARIVETTPAKLAEWRDEIAQAIATLQAKADSGDAVAGAALRTQRLFERTVDEFSLTLPGLLIEDRLVIEGERRVEIRTEGRGHTVSDVFVWLPGDDVVITGDLSWNGIHPRMHDGFPLAWADYAESLLGLNPKHVVPGHGAPGGSEILTGLPEYFRAVAELVEAVRSGANAAEMEPPAVSADWAGSQRFRSGIETLAARPAE